ncbi:MAG: regulatory protein RecX [Chloroflexi bacterium]|nr:regulatory protein RecX [Chloroflexota bacterium]
MNEADVLEKAVAAGLRFLSYRPRSEAEMRDRLRRRYSDEVVQAAIQRLKEDGLVDDRAFALAWSESRASHRPRSAALVRRELLEKGVPRDIAQEAAVTVDDEVSAYSAGQRAAASLTEADYQTFRRRLWGYLHRRGFSQSIIRRTTRRLWEEGGGGQ